MTKFYLFVIKSREVASQIRASSIAFSVVHIKFFPKHQELGQNNRGFADKHWWNGIGSRINQFVRWASDEELTATIADKVTYFLSDTRL